MVEIDQYGYKETEVGGTPLTMKHTQQGTDKSALARRLATLDEVIEVRLEFDGSIQLHLSTEDGPLSINRGGKPFYVPEGWRIRDVMIHPHKGSHAHVVVEQE